MSFSTAPHFDRIGVLLVDDDRLVLRGLARAIRSLRPSWRIATAESAAEALRVLDSELMQVLITDLDMPEVPGDELCAVVRQAYPSIVRIVHTSDADVAAASLDHPNATQPVVRKPLSSDALERLLAWAVAELCDRAAAVNPTSYLTASSDDEDGSQSA